MKDKVAFVTSSEQVKAAVDLSIELYGRLDFEFKNAGVQARNVNTADMTEEEYDRVMNINLKGIWHCMKYELIHMSKQGSGAIVNNSSIGCMVYWVLQKVLPRNMQPTPYRSTQFVRGQSTHPWCKRCSAWATYPKKLPKSWHLLTGWGNLRKLPMQFYGFAVLSPAL